MPKTTRAPRVRRRPRLFCRGASLVEYALIILGVMLLAAGAYRLLGSSIGKGADSGSSELASGEGSSGGGGGGSTSSQGGGGESAGGGGGGGGGGAGQMSASDKVEVGGSVGQSGDTSGTAGGGPPGVASDEVHHDTHAISNVAIKRSFSIAFLLVGLLAVGYVINKARTIKKDAEPDKGPPSMQ